ncbi:MAG TPA: DUF1549 domain-containing protein, partial [Verrucomicrobiaceae bacterium]
MAQTNAAAKSNQERAFQSLDTNHDGRVSQQEFMKLGTISAYFRDHPDQVAPVFRKLDAAGSGFLDLAGFLKLYDLGKGRNTPKPDPAPNPPPVSTPPQKPEANSAMRADDLAFFEKNIRPVLAEKCYKCHSAESEKVKGGLVLDTREGIRKGGETGPAVVPGDVTRSLLLEAMRYGNKDLQMPPEKEGGKLSNDVIANFERWVSSGAPDPRDGSAPSAVASKTTSWDAQKAMDHWAFKPPQHQDPPTVKHLTWPKSDLDRFILAQLEAKSLAPVADAGPAALVRRIYFDLLGLPPAPGEADQFVNEAAKDRGHAVENLVDRLLKSPQFGERWGRHWLDVARYAESTGRDVNCTLPHAWRYRDYVISALNADKPYNQFIREQISGDLLPAKDNRERAEHQIATGFLAIGSRSLGEKNPKQFYLDMADEQIDAVSQAFLGLTVACARCHDHKFDPISQRDYYALAGIFLSTDTLYGAAPTFQNPRATRLIDLPTDCGLPRLPKVLSPGEREKKNAELVSARKFGEEIYNTVYLKLAAGKVAGGLRGDAKNGIKMNASSVMIRDLEIDLDSYEANGASKLLAMGVQDLPVRRPGRPTARPATITQVMQLFSARPQEFTAIDDSPMFARGDVAKPGEKVPRGFLSLFSHGNAAKIAA